MKLCGHRGQAEQEASPPAWGRGLKHFKKNLRNKPFLSPPAWGRGLKLLR